MIDFWALLSQEWAFLLLVGLGCYVQAVMGFAGGLVVVGGVAALGLMDIQLAAVVMSFITLFNTLFALRKNRAEIKGKWVFAVLLGALPATLVGIMILDHLSDDNQGILKIILGGVIILSCLPLLFKGPELERISSKGSFLLYGAVAGVIGGLFATYGPILVYLFYRQPVELKTIRDSLLAIFAITALGRLLFVIARDSYPETALGLSLLSLPVVLGATWLGRQYPPPLSDRGMKRIAFVLLIAAGISMMIPR